MRGWMVGALVIVTAIAASGCKNRRQSGTEPCTPGAPIVVACSDSCGIGACNGDPILRVCDGDLSVAQCDAATSGGYLAENDDDRVCTTSGYCSRVDTVCPTSGHVTVSTRGFGGRDYNCAWEIQEGATVP